MLSRVGVLADPAEAKPMSEAQKVFASVEHYAESNVAVVKSPGSKTQVWMP